MYISSVFGSHEVEHTLQISTVVSKTFVIVRDHLMLFMIIVGKSNPSQTITHVPFFFYRTTSTVLGQVTRQSPAAPLEQ